MVIRDPWIRALVIVLLLIAGLYLVGLIWQVAAQFSDILLLFFLAWVVAFILEPVVVLLRRHGRLPRPVAVTVAYLGLLIVAVWGVLWLVPPLSRQVIQVAADLPTYADLATDQVAVLQAALAERGLDVNLASLVNHEELVRRAETVAPPIVSNAVALATSIASFFVQLAIVLILSFYVMLDGQRIAGGLLQTVPTAIREDVLFFFASVNRAFAGFLRGQLVQALIYSLSVAAVMWSIGLDLVLLTAVVNTLLMLIPFVGPPLALVMPLAIAYIERPGLFWATVVVVNVIQAVVLNVVAPRVMSSTIGVHPLLVFVGLLGGGKIAGIWGALFGVPVVAVIAAMASFYRATLEQRRAPADGTVVTGIEAEPVVEAEEIVADSEVTGTGVRRPDEPRGMPLAGRSARS